MADKYTCSKCGCTFFHTSSLFNQIPASGDGWFGGYVCPDCRRELNEQNRHEERMQAERQRQEEEERRFRERLEAEEERSREAEFEEELRQSKEEERYRQQREADERRHRERMEADEARRNEETRPHQKRYVAEENGHPSRGAIHGEAGVFSEFESFSRGADGRSSRVVERAQENTARIDEDKKKIAATIAQLGRDLESAIDKESRIVLTLSALAACAECRYYKDWNALKSLAANAVRLSKERQDYHVSLSSEFKAAGDALDRAGSVDAMLELRGHTNWLETQERRNINAIFSPYYSDASDYRKDIDQTLSEVPDANGQIDLILSFLIENATSKNWNEVKRLTALAIQISKRSNSGQSARFRAASVALDKAGSVEAMLLLRQHADWLESRSRVFFPTKSLQMVKRISAVAAIVGLFLPGWFGWLITLSGAATISYLLITKR